MASIIKAIQWWPIASPNLPANIADWLMEQGSMTQRLEQHCQKVKVAPQQQCFVPREELGEELGLLPVSQHYWLREVILYGDDTPWVLGRTVIPEQTLSGADRALMDLGTLPLGRYLFSGNNLTRDYIQIGRQGKLWARRSLLRLSGNPLLLTEVFLSESPFYRALPV